MIRFSFGTGPFLIAGPCAVEDDETMARVADVLAEIGARFSLPVCFKASFDKANRANAGSPRGPGLAAGLESLARVREKSGLPTLTDVHLPQQVPAVAAVVDVIQIPAFLSRQTDLLIAAGATGLPVNIKKGQWMRPEAMAGAVEKVRSAGATDVAVTERGTFFGYGDLVVDMRNIPRLRKVTKAAVIYDAGHSVQQPGEGSSGTSGGLREFLPNLMLAAAAAGCDGFFIETHPDPDRAISDAATQWPLDQLASLVERAMAVREAALEDSGD